MIIDASAILAIMLDEPERKDFRAAIAAATEPMMSPFNYLEAAVRVDKIGGELAGALDAVIRELDIRIAPATEHQARLAREAYREFGKGNHPAELYLGDCFAYALAKSRNEPLLFKGNDFSQTDVEAAL